MMCILDNRNQKDIDALKSVSSPFCTCHGFSFTNGPFREIAKQIIKEENSSFSDPSDSFRPTLEIQFRKKRKKEKGMREQLLEAEGDVLCAKSKDANYTEADFVEDFKEGTIKS